MALLARFFEVRSARAREELEEEAAEPAPSVSGITEASIAELDELRLMNDRLAAALGACYLCWGKRADCPNCEGRGSSGWVASDKASFAELVRPALIRMSGRRDSTGPLNGNGAEHPFN
jgi:hypothetical protein